jgi:hypothetical protein
MQATRRVRAGVSVMVLSCALWACMDTGIVGVSGPQPGPGNVDAGVSPVSSSACSLDCQQLGQLCEPRASLCVACLTDADCERAGKEPFCDSARGECVRCREHDDCPLSSPLCLGGECRRCPGAERDGICEAPPRCMGRECDGDVFDPRRRDQDDGPDGRGPRSESEFDGGRD